MYCVATDTSAYIEKNCTIIKRRAEKNSAEAWVSVSVGSGDGAGKMDGNIGCSTFSQLFMGHAANTTERFLELYRKFQFGFTTLETTDN